MGHVDPERHLTGQAADCTSNNDSQDQSRDSRQWGRKVSPSHWEQVDQYAIWWGIRRKIPSYQRPAAGALLKLKGGRFLQDRRRVSRDDTHCKNITDCIQFYHERSSLMWTGQD
ncbi:hypothetical protein POX_d05441 [Penicillium oxalicum]|uniref:Uncharacterized protein n=1 Tax=Penicillium oxalicum (strain 114-2 / CGMCC 5302) TaxID=933388 RepID=S7ZP01_PENO1|nr:hypothetical protein POX_d05441 [Penicillium oxalicum]EPS32395.1 hypothetical protein PDE_07355 [Penicillium oxalicum 114-2]KAI2789941.1 hypothetical protein POX_d05441 [Penicillium oxalicum]